MKVYFYITLISSTIYTNEPSFTMKKRSLGILKKLKFLPPHLYVKYHYEYYTGKKLNLENPVEFNEKIQWLKVYYRPDILTTLVDKYSVREYVKEKIGERYLNELIAVYDHAGDVNFESLPEQCVIKSVHASNYNIIVPDKSKLNRFKAKLLMHKWMLKNQYYRGGLEWAYKNVRPRIIVEKYLKEEGRKALNDYKFFCFNGEPAFLQVDIGRGYNHQRGFYDLQWNLLPFRKSNKVKELKKGLKMPEKFEEMKVLAQTLAHPFPFVRVDFYSIQGTIYFGEMTFYPSDGISEFIPDKYNRIIGEKIQLPKIPKGQKEIKEI